MTNRSIFAAVGGCLLALSGCTRERVAPLGKLDHAKLSEWQADCSSALIEKPASEKDPRTSGRADLAPSFQHATRRFFCKPPGWSLYVDGADRLVGLCVDDNLVPDPVEDEMTRARPFVAKHVPPSMAIDMTKGNCPAKPENIGHGLIRWKQESPRVVNPDGSLKTTGSLWACCWEVQD